MFATASAHAPTAIAGAYRQVGVVTGVGAATPHQLVLMLFDGFDDALAQAIGTLAADLRDLYAYVSLRLLQANLNNDGAALDECRRLMRPIRDAWASIAPAAPYSA
jgi:flagellar protein FliS